MLKNKLLKRLLKLLVFPLISFFNRLVKKRNIILIYANSQGLRDNLLYVYKKLLELNLNKKYKIYLYCEKKTQSWKADNVFCVSKIQSIKVFLSASYVFYAFGQLPIKPTKKQAVVHLTHGSPFKKDGLLIGANKNVGKINYFNKLISTSDFYKPYFCQIFGLKDDETIIVNGMPRTDEFEISKPNSIVDTNIILWLPTFRQSNYLGMNNGSNNYLPIFNEDIDGIRSICEKYNVKLIIKLHPLQDLDNYKNIVEKHIEIYSDKDFILKYDSLYSFMNKTSALITDYSSVFLDYIVLDRPIAFTNDDINDYDNNRGLLFEDDERFDIGQKIGNRDEFDEFLREFKKDKYKRKRQQLNCLVNPVFSEKKNTENLFKMIGLI